MFSELQEIEKIQYAITNLVDSKQQLDYKCLQAFSSNSNKIQKSVFKILKTILSQSQKTLSTIKQIQDELQLGYFVPSNLEIQSLVYDSSQLPEWFEFVFKKQYDKQKKNLDGLCKKTYKMQSLPQVKHNLQKQVQSFRLLLERYQILNPKQKTSLNVMGEAELIKAKTKICKQKYNSFCKIISSKILVFLEESISKSLNFSNSMNVIGSNVSSSFNVKLQPQQFQRAYLTNKFKQTSPTYETNSYFGQKANKSVDFYGKTMYSRTGNQYSRYVPRHINTTVYDFYN